MLQKVVTTPARGYFSYRIVIVITEQIEIAGCINGYAVGPIKKGRCACGVREAGRLRPLYWPAKV